MSENWDNYAADWDSNPAVIEYADNAYNSLRQEVNPDSYRILDFGCGTGLLSERLSSSAKSIVALDPSPNMASALKNKGLSNVSTIASELNQNLIHSNDLLKQDFDLIVASSSLAFVTDYPATLKLLKQLLKVDGHLLQWDWLKDESDEGAGFSKQQIESAMTAAGFKEYATSIPFCMQAENSKMDVIMCVAKNTH
ncbi:class I SAM-dependent DNA methyltransferase [Marinobacter xestospongiae]|uniref:Methyltransferase domain-containing protein n=1 Tax=Marinobacter xestospongiae TaxID=994319 RepID=A0ABU3VWX7_9GAMM|nr:methyltransferase domain-containing protein [Marinobacter xestospongiae]MCK7566396.1 methyltransferase domain-containing protein [Marinobacter xestospongiae]MDV2078261.1 methyltransferase domain-containing protein [Marinobacter xestospongiae]